MPGLTQSAGQTMNDVRQFMMRTWTIIAMAVMVLTASAMAAFMSGDAEWFARAGSLATVFGLVLMLRQNLLCAAGDIDTAIIEKLHHNTPPPAPGTAAYEHDVARARRIVRDEMLGFSITLLGTVTWGYGDLLMGLMV